ncbi:MAG: hypothetical protein JNM62_03545 [Flavobacteriales bacterium]|nr:hypothetical protein [Flavobacteriales bacterium]
MSLNAVPNTTRWTDLLPGAVTVIGIVLALIQFLHCRSLWVDEAMLALNIVERSPRELFAPLADRQVAPLLFLLLEKLLSWIIPNSEYGLRLLPLLCHAVASFAFLRITQSLFKHVAVQVFAVSLFAFNTNLILYASEVKQYMGDLAVCCSMFWFVLRPSLDRRGVHLLGAFATIAIWFSSATPIITVAAFAYLLHRTFNERTLDRSWLRNSFLWGAVWCIVLAIYYFATVQDHPARAFMERFWLDANGLLPNDPFSTAFYMALYERAHQVFTVLLPYGFRNFYPLQVLCPIGLLSLALSPRKGLLVLLLAPIALHLALAILHLYPFETRLVLYLIPCFILLGVEGAHRSFKWISKALPGLEHPALLILLPAIVAFPLFRAGYPREKQEIKPCLAHIADHARPGDRIYVDIGAQAAFRYYAHIRAFDLPEHVVFGPVNDDQEYYLQQGLTQHGPTWFVFTHMRKRDTNTIIAALTAQGLKPTDQFAARSAQVYRYELP